MVTYLTEIVITLILSAFFSGMEIAFVASNKLRLEVDKKQGDFPSGIIRIFTANPSQYIATMLVGNNIVLVIYGLIMSNMLDPYVARYIGASESGNLLIQTVLSTIIILITGEFLPKTFFRQHANAALNLFAIPILLFYVTLWPIARFASWVSHALIKGLFKIKNDSNTPLLFGRIDLDNLVREGEETEKEDAEAEIQIFRNALDFAETKVRECLIPRTEIEAIEMGSTIEELKEKFITTGYSRVLIYQDSIDNIVGFVHSSDLFENPRTIREVITPVSIFPGTMPASQLLEQFISEKKSIAVVVDEFGGTDGIVTLEDVLEEIIGDIEDEHDSPEFVEKVLSETEYLFSGRLEIDYLNEKYGLCFSESDEYETLAGYILAHHNHFPSEKDVLEIEHYTLIIEKATETRIELVKVIKPDE